MRGRHTSPPAGRIGAGFPMFDQSYYSLEYLVWKKKITRKEITRLEKKNLRGITQFTFVEPKIICRLHNEILESALNLHQKNFLIDKVL